jgi:hypothetical protein
VTIPSYWRHLVNEPQSTAELDAIRTCVNRQRPFGEKKWVMQRSSELGIAQTLNDIGRPRRARSTIL